MRQETAASKFQSGNGELRTSPEGLARKRGSIPGTTLTNVISAARLVADRLQFIDGLHALVFRPDQKAMLKERKHLHRILAEETWIFGEEFALTVDDQSLTEVLRMHVTEKHDVVIDREVFRPEGTPNGRRRGIVDLVLSRRIPTAFPNELRHLVIELKAPRKALEGEDTQQIQSYAYAVAGDERLRGVEAHWDFWLVGNELSPFVRSQMDNAHLPRGVLQQSKDGRITIHVKTWAELLLEARGRHELFQKKLNYAVNREDALQQLRQAYARILGDAELAAESTVPEIEDESAVDDEAGEDEAATAGEDVEPEE